jgi:hypothetical protein
MASKEKMKRKKNNERKEKGKESDLRNDQMTQ